jgi:hypothetical protein
MTIVKSHRTGLAILAAAAMLTGCSGLGSPPPALNASAPNAASSVFRASAGANHLSLAAAPMPVPRVDRRPWWTAADAEAGGRVDRFQ